jgi:hypothetical protein
MDPHTRSPYHDPELAMAALRRERRVLRGLDLLAPLLGWSLIAVCLWLVIVESRRDASYVLLSLHGALANLSRLVIHQVRAVPRVVEALISPDPAVRSAACAIVDAHRTEILGDTHLQSHRDDPPLGDLPCEAIAARLRANGPRADWRRIGRWWLAIWSLGLVALVVAMIIVAPR